MFLRKYEEVKGWISALITSQAALDDQWSQDTTISRAKQDQDLGNKEIHSNVGVAEDSALINIGQRHEPRCDMCLLSL